MKITKQLLVAGAMVLSAGLLTGTGASAGDRYYPSYDNRAYDSYRELQLGAGVGVSRNYGHGYRSRSGVRVGVGIGFGRSYQSDDYRRAYREDYRSARSTYRERSYHRPRTERLIQNDDYVEGRTRFCRYESRVKAYSGRRVKVKRCVFVRNDLLGVYASEGWSRH